MDFWWAIPQKTLYFPSKTHIFIKSPFRKLTKKNHDFWTHVGVIFDHFGIKFHNFFGIDFCIDFLSDFWSKMVPKWLSNHKSRAPLEPQKTLYLLCKTHIFIKSAFCRKPWKIWKSAVSLQFYRENCFLAMVPFTTFFGHGFLDAFLVPLWLPFGTLWAPHATLLASIDFLLAFFCFLLD